MMYIAFLATIYVGLSFVEKLTKKEELKKMEDEANDVHIG
jgi:hypothetical protein